jgi:hypothetical protein
LSRVQKMAAEWVQKVAAERVRGAGEWMPAGGQPVPASREWVPIAGEPVPAPMMAGALPRWNEAREWWIRAGPFAPQGWGPRAAPE